jgi:hypothetical protein
MKTTRTQNLLAAALACALAHKKVDTPEGQLDKEGFA